MGPCIFNHLINSVATDVKVKSEGGCCDSAEMRRPAIMSAAPLPAYDTTTTAVEGKKACEIGS